MQFTTLSDFYYSLFSCKVYKIALDSGCTCPNRDGTKGTGGCIFCSQSGSGDFVSDTHLSIKEQIQAAKERVQKKLSGRAGTRKGKFIAYFQNFSATYGDAKKLKELWLFALEQEDVEGLSIATRPDCLTNEILDVITYISKSYFVQIELGLQTSNEETGKKINRCYSNDDYINAIKKLRSLSSNIHIVTHLIFGLPEETEQDMLESVKFVVQNNKEHLYGIKITSLYVLKETALAQLYTEEKYTPLLKDEYFVLLKKTLPLLGKNCIIHRLTGDPPKKLLLAPDWMTDKKRVLNELSALLAQIAQE